MISYWDWTGKQTPAANAVADVEGAALLIDPAAGDASGKALPGIMDAIGANAVRPIVNASDSLTVRSSPQSVIFICYQFAFETIRIF